MIIERKKLKSIGEECKKKGDKNTTGKKEGNAEQGFTI
jgi:hypothetical protein